MFSRGHSTRFRDGRRGRSSRRSGSSARHAIAATDRFLAELDERNRQAPPVAYPDADATLRELAAAGAQLMLSTGSSPERARRVLDQEGWDGFTVVLGSDARLQQGHRALRPHLRAGTGRRLDAPRGHGR